MTSSADFLFQTAIDFHSKGDMEAARLHYLAALRDNPQHLASLMNLGDLLSRKNQIAAGSAMTARAVRLAPENGTIWANYGVFLKRQERYVEAREALINAVHFAPDHIGAWHALLLLDLREKKFDDALRCYEKIRALGGDSPTIQNDLAHVYLGQGNLDKAFETYEARWHILSHMEPWDFHLQEWQGEDLKDKLLLVHAEQGFGDSIMTSRFLPLLLERGAIVTLAVEPATVELFEAQDWNIEVINIHDLVEDRASLFDFHSPLYSAMRWLGIKREDIDPEPFLKAPLISVPPVFAFMFNVGICWFSGRRGNYMDWRRRISSLEDWLPLAEVPNVQLWSLAPGDEAQSEIIRLGAEALVLDEVTKFTNFAETAAFIAKLDLVISVDTAAAHLAAAMGKPTWMLSQFTPCWRWWGLEDGTGEPWYETMRVLGQPAPGDWKSQLAECKRRLEAETLQ